MSAFSTSLLLVVSLTEIVLLAVVVGFFFRLRRSQAVLDTLQQRQETLLSKLHFNTELEQELVSSFAKRQAELADLEQQLSARADELRRLVEQAEKAARSPRLMREIIISGNREGKSSQALALATGLSVDEVELILEQSGA